MHHYTYAEPNKHKKGLINFTIQAVVRGDYILILLAFPAKGKLQSFSIKMYMYFQMSLDTPSLCPHSANSDGHVISFKTITDFVIKRPNVLCNHFVLCCVKIAKNVVKLPSMQLKLSFFVCLTM